jgi:hypothetical protein
MKRKELLVILLISIMLTLMIGCAPSAPSVQYGSIDITSTPTGAKVYLNGVDTGMVTPIIFTKEVGNYNVNLDKFHYKTWEGTITVNADQTTYINAPLPYASTETITLQPGAEGKDDSVNLWSPDSSDGNWIMLWSGYTALEKTCRAYLQFDLSTVPGNARIIDASLILYQNTARGSGSFNVGLYQVNSYWGENTITWNNQPTSSTMVEASCFVNFDCFIWRIWNNIGDLVQGWLDESIANYGMLLKATTDETSLTLLVSFWSSDYTDDPSKRPKLTVDYYIP